MKRGNPSYRPTPKIVLVKCSSIAPRRSEAETVLRTIREREVMPQGADLLIFGSSDLSPQGEPTGQDWSIAIHALIANFPELEAYFTITKEGSAETRIETGDIMMNAQTAHDHGTGGYYRIFVFYPGEVDRL